MPQGMGPTTGNSLRQTAFALPPRLDWCAVTQHHSLSVCCVTTISQYLRAETPDYSEPVTFYAPGAYDWGQRAYIAQALAIRSRAPREHIYSAEPGERSEDVVDTDA